MKHRTLRFVVAGILLLLSACSSIAMPTKTQQTTPTTIPGTTDDANVEHIELGVGYIPNVQFAPYYVAQAKGFYNEEGLQVDLEYGYENDFVALTGQGKRQFAVASGDQVILARAQGLPIVYVMKWYQRYPVGVMALAETGINVPGKLEGHSVGIPGTYGASYAGWKALVYSSGLEEESIRLESIGFTQAEAVSQGQVDASVIYIANEPVQLKHAGQQVNVIEVSDYIDIVSNGIVTNETLIRDDPDLVRRIVRATLRGITYTLDNPEEAFEIVRQVVPEISDENAPVQRDVLEASIGLWRSENPGVTDAQAWEDTVEAMLATGLIKSRVDVDSLFTNQFVE